MTGEENITGEINSYSRARRMIAGLVGEGIILAGGVTYVAVEHGPAVGIAAIIVSGGVMSVSALAMNRANQRNMDQD